MERSYSRFNQLLFFIFLGLFIFIPLYPKFPLLEVSGTYVAVRIEDVLIALALGAWFIVNIHHLKYMLSQTIYQALLLFWFIGFLSLVSGIFISHSVVLHLGLLHWLRRVEVMSLFLIGSTVVTSKKQVSLLVKSLVAETVAISLYGFGQVYLSLPVVSTTNREFSKGLILTLTKYARPNSTFAGHYDLAAFLSMVLAFLCSLFFYYKKLYQKVLVTFTGIISFALLGMTAARVSYVAALTGLALSLWLVGKRLLIIGLVLISVATVVFIPPLRDRLIATVRINILDKSSSTYQPVAPSVRQVNDFEFIKTATNSLILKETSMSATASKSATLSADIAPGEPTAYTELDVYRSFNIRFNVEWPRALDAFYKNPVLGTGYSSLTIATDNDYLRSLGETGFLGTISLGLIFLIIFRKLVRSLKNSKSLEKFFVISSICAMVALAITAVFIDVLEASKVASVFWMILGVGWAISKGYKENLPMINEDEK